MCLSTALINIYMVNITKNQIIDITDVSGQNDIDAILILGCKAYSDVPSLMLENRLLKAYEVYNLLNTKLLLSGDHGKKKYDEVNVMRDYLLDIGLPSEDIFLDHAGFSTYDSIYRAKYVFGAKKVIIVTQEYHLYRALYFANKLGIDAFGVKAEDIPYRSIMFKNEIREILARDKGFLKGIFKPESKYVGEPISLNQNGEVTKG